MLRPRGKSRLQSAGRNFLFRQPADQLHGCGGHGNRSGNRKRSCRSRIRRSTQRRKKRTGRSRRGRSTKRPRDTEIAQTFDRVCHFSCGTDVFFHGTYDVGLAGSGCHERQSCGNGTLTDASDHYHHGDQPEILCKRIYQPASRCTKYGYAGGTRCRGIVWLQYLCSVCYDWSTGARRYGRGHGIYA